MQRNPSYRLQGAARPSHRQSGEYRGRNSFGANGDPAVGGAQNHGQFGNGHARTNGLIGGSQHFDLARSPPNTTNKSIFSFHFRCIDLTGFVLHRYQTRSLQVFQTRCLSSRTSLPLPSLYRCYNRDRPLQILCQGVLNKKRAMAI